MDRSVVITGASSGIGKASVASLSRAGWTVFAAVRKAADARKLEAEYPGVRSVSMDLQDEGSIRAAAQQVEAQCNGNAIDGLANVAGIGMVRPVKYASLPDIREIFEVNVFGQIATIQAFAPLLRKRRGRIVNITSVGVNVAIPFGGLLNASKSAFGMLSDTMRLELRPFGIRVLTIEPGAIATPAVDKTLGNMEHVIESLPPEAQMQYGAMLMKFARQAYTREKDGSPAEVVADAIHHALTSSRPRIRYRVGKHAKLLAAMAKILPDWLFDEIRMQMFGLDGVSNSLAPRKIPPSQIRRPARPARA